MSRVNVDLRIHLGWQYHNSWLDELSWLLHFARIKRLISPANFHGFGHGWRNDRPALQSVRPSLDLAGALIKRTTDLSRGFIRFLGFWAHDKSWRYKAAKGSERSSYQKRRNQSMHPISSNQLKVWSLDTTLGMVIMKKHPKNESRFWLSRICTDFKLSSYGLPSSSPKWKVTEALPNFGVRMNSAQSMDSSCRLDVPKRTPQRLGNRPGEDLAKSKFWPHSFDTLELHPERWSPLSGQSTPEMPEILGGKLWSFKLGKWEKEVMLWVFTCFLPGKQVSEENLSTGPTEI